MEITVRILSPFLQKIILFDKICTVEPKIQKKEMIQMSNPSNCCSCPETLAMASVPMQEWCEPYDLKLPSGEGTVFLA